MDGFGLRIVGLYSEYSTHCWCSKVYLFRWLLVTQRLLANKTDWNMQFEDMYVHSFGNDCL